MSCIPCCHPDFPNFCNNSVDVEGNFMKLENNCDSLCLFDCRKYYNGDSAEAVLRYKSRSTHIIADSDVTFKPVLDGIIAKFRTANYFEILLKSLRALNPFTIACRAGNDNLLSIETVYSVLYSDKFTESDVVDMNFVAFYAISKLAKNHYLTEERLEYMLSSSSVCSEWFERSTLNVMLIVTSPMNCKYILDNICVNGFKSIAPLYVECTKSICDYKFLGNYNIEEIMSLEIDTFALQTTGCCCYRQVSRNKVCNYENGDYGTFLADRIFYIHCEYDNYEDYMADYSRYHDSDGRLLSSQPDEVCCRPPSVVKKKVYIYDNYDPDRPKYVDDMPLPTGTFVYELLSYRMVDPCSLQNEYDSNGGKIYGKIVTVDRRVLSDEVMVTAPTDTITRWSSLSTIPSMFDEGVSTFTPPSELMGLMNTHLISVAGAAYDIDTTLASDNVSISSEGGTGGNCEEPGVATSRVPNSNDITTDRIIESHDIVRS